MKYDADDFNTYMTRLIKGFSFGLAGASLVVICQFVGDQRIDALYLLGLIASMPMLACAGLLAEMVHSSYRRHEGPLQGAVFVLFIVALVANLYCFAGVLWSIRPVFGVAFGIGIGLGYGAVLLLFKLAKKAD